MTSPDPIALLTSHPALMQRIAFASFDFDVVASDRRYPITVRAGRVELRSGAAADFIVKSTDEAWTEFAKSNPKPGYNDVVALIESGHAQLEGDALPFFRHLFFVKAAVAAIFRGDLQI